ncbi:hypothetical protein StoSoilB13_27700 (plasmid) [Arthrobacter sp. StoSoilB13]|nr:hypothetical protein StoSoilB13_27700 [Arthrobacter sp. StoSoilB13]
MVSALKIDHARADFGNRTRSFMAQNHWKGSGSASVDNGKVRVAQARTLDSHLYLPRARFWTFKLFEFEGTAVRVWVRGASAAEHGATHRHGLHTFQWFGYSGAEGSRQWPRS